MQRGVSFVPPRTCFEASRLIDQLKRRRPEPVADRRREIRAVQETWPPAAAMPRTWSRAETRSATEAGRPGSEAHSDTPTVIETRRAGQTNARVELARYTISAGEHVI